MVVNPGSLTSRILLTIQRQTKLPALVNLWYGAKEMAQQKRPPKILDDGNFSTRLWAALRALASSDSGPNTKAVKMFSGYVRWGIGYRAMYKSSSAEKFAMTCDWKILFGFSSMLSPKIIFFFSISVLMYKRAHVRRKWSSQLFLSVIGHRRAVVNLSKTS